jgi:hypothetical protein
MRKVRKVEKKKKLIFIAKVVLVHKEKMAKKKKNKNLKKKNIKRNLRKKEINLVIENNQKNQKIQTSIPIHHLKNLQV